LSEGGGVGEEELVERLQKSFKLTRYEAKLYLALLKGASNPKEASSLSGVPLPRIYDVIRVLESKGFVIPSEGWYRPLPPSAVAVAEIARVESEARSRVKQIMETAEMLESLATSVREVEEISMLEGVYTIISAVAEAVEKSRILLLVVSTALKGREREFEALVRSSASRGVATLIVGVKGVKPGFEGVPGNVRVVESASWLPDMIATDLSVVYVVPDRRSNTVKGLLVRDPLYASEVLRGVRETLGL